MTRSAASGENLSWPAGFQGRKWTKTRLQYHDLFRIWGLADFCEPWSQLSIQCTSFLEHSWKLWNSLQEMLISQINVNLAITGECCFWAWRQSFMAYYKSYDADYLHNFEDPPIEPYRKLWLLDALLTFCSRLHWGTWLLRDAGRANSTCGIPDSAEEK